MEVSNRGILWPKEYPQIVVLAACYKAREKNEGLKYFASKLLSLFVASYFSHLYKAAIRLSISTSPTVFVRLHEKRVWISKCQGKNINPLSGFWRKPLFFDFGTLLCQKLGLQLWISNQWVEKPIAWLYLALLVLLLCQRSCLHGTLGICSQ